MLGSGTCQYALDARQVPNSCAPREPIARPALVAVLFPALDDVVSGLPQFPDSGSEAETPEQSQGGQWRDGLASFQIGKDSCLLAHVALPNESCGQHNATHKKVISQTFDQGLASQRHRPVAQRSAARSILGSPFAVECGRPPGLQQRVAQP